MSIVFLAKEIVGTCGKYLPIKNILSSTSTKKSQKPDPESVFFIVLIRQKSLKEIPKALNFGVVLLIRLRSIYYLQEELLYRFSLRKRLDRI